MNVLVAGCGLRPKPGCVNLDSVALPGVDVVFDLNTIELPTLEVLEQTTFDGIRLLYEPGYSPDHVPNLFAYKFLPLRTGEFDRVEAEDVLEHVDDPIAVVQEFGRVLKVGGELWIRGPDGRYPEIVWADLTHKRAFARRSFDGFDPGTHDGKHYGHYHGPIEFRVVNVVERNKGLEFTLIKRG